LLAYSHRLLVSSIVRLCSFSAGHLSVACRTNRVVTSTSSNQFRWQFAYTTTSVELLTWNRLNNPSNTVGPKSG
jgi:hypothetical protein